jgi:hypothetical protein
VGRQDLKAGGLNRKKVKIRKIITLSLPNQVDLLLSLDVRIPGSLIFVLLELTPYPRSWFFSLRLSYTIGFISSVVS